MINRYERVSRSFTELGPGLGLRVPVNGGEAVALGLGPTEHVAVDDRFVYFDYWSHDVYRAAK